MVLSQNRLYFGVIWNYDSQTNILNFRLLGFKKKKARKSDKDKHTTSYIEDDIKIEIAFLATRSNK